MANIIPTVKSADLSITLDRIANDFDLKSLIAEGSIVSKVGRELAGEVESLSGVLNNNAAYEVQRLEDKQGLSSSGDWGYYAKQLADMPSQRFKVWVRWNVEEGIYDYYLKANAHEVFTHETPNVKP